MRKLFKKTLVFVLSAAMALSFAMPAKKADADTYDQTFNVSTAAELKAALKTIDEDESGTSNYLINITDNISSEFGIAVKKNTVTVDGNNKTMTCTPGGGVVWAQNKGTVLKIQNIILQGTNTAEDGTGLVNVLDEATFEMNAGTVIKDYKANNTTGGGVTVGHANFIMNGGTIENCSVVGPTSNCYGGGVAVMNGSLFTMNGGIIKDCYVQNTAKQKVYAPYTAGGGVLVSLYSSFVLDGGTIKDCYAEGDDAVGGGVAIHAHINEYWDADQEWGHLGSSFEFRKGTITGCKATCFGGGIYAGGYYINPNPLGSIMVTHCPAGHTPGIYMTGGTIDGNQVANGSEYGPGGGGLAFWYIIPTVTVSDVTISNNKAPSGGGITVFDELTTATFNNCTITGNEATYSGGGVELNSAVNETGQTISNCTITDNTSGDIGAGVYYDKYSKLNITGANEIQDNIYDNKQNNLNILDSNHPVYVTGSLAGSEIGLSDPTLWNDGLDDDDPTAVSTPVLTSGYKSNNSGVNPKTYFTSDHATWYPDFSDVNENEVRLFRIENDSEIAGGNIIVDGLISVTLWAKLDASSESEREDYSMQFTSGSDTQTASYDPTKKTKYNNEDYYGFTYKVKTIQMADTITGKLLQNGQETGVQKDYSVQTYAENMLEKSNDALLKDMLVYLLNYGAFSQIYFDYNTSKLPNVNYPRSDEIIETSIDSDYAYDIEDDSLDGIDVKKSLSLGIDEGVNVTFKFYARSDVDMDEYKATLASDPSDPFFVQEDGKTTYDTETMPFTKFEGVENKLYTIDLLNVPASRFDDMLTLTVAKGGGPSNKYQVKFSVFSYAYAVCNDDAEYTDTSQIKPEKMNDLKNLLKSMYVFNGKAEAYAKANPNKVFRYKITKN